jgi:hypothetical protein
MMNLISQLGTHAIDAITAIINSSTISDKDTWIEGY